jgi:hypothetical protein
MLKLQVTRQQLARSILGVLPMPVYSGPQLNHRMRILIAKTLVA